MEPEYVEALFNDKKFIPVNLIDLIKSHHLRDAEFFDKDEDGAEEHDDIERYLLQAKNYGFLLSWIAVLLKLKHQLENSSSEFEAQYKQAFTTYFSIREGAYIDLFEILFAWLRNLTLGQAEQKSLLTGKTNELSNIGPEWEDFNSQDALFKLMVQLIYYFASKFPKYFRNWFGETSKPNQKEAERIIKTFISMQIFGDEKTLIESKSAEWKSDEFGIQVIKGTREIIANYTKEGQKLEIAINIPEDYPLNFVKIEVSKGVKISEVRLNKCLLMMKSILTNMNGTFLSALMLCKTNIDREFEGVEECAICYYIVDSVTKDLPTLPCKTCKHKFHSACIKRWFDSSNKSDCPLCKSQFL